MRRVTNLSLMAAIFAVVAIPAFAQVGGGLGAGLGGGTGLGDTVFNWFYQNFMHAIAASGVILMLVGLLIMRSHIYHFLCGGLALICIGNYSTILGWAGL